MEKENILREDKEKETKKNGQGLVSILEILTIQEGIHENIVRDKEKALILKEIHISWHVIN